jgi:hypothetical protein
MPAAGTSANMPLGHFCRSVRTPAAPAFSTLSSDAFSTFRPLILQCQLQHAASSAERLYYPRPEPFFAPFAVPTVERAVWPELLFGEVSPR